MKKRLAGLFELRLGAGGGSEGALGFGVEHIQAGVLENRRLSNP